MKLQKKKLTNIKVLGEIVSCDEYGCIAVKTEQGVVWYYRSLAELNEEWEDYEEAKTEFYITAWGDIREYTTKEERFAFKQKLEIGNCFETREEAEQAVEKLKAWKRLKDKGFRFDVMPALGHCDDEKFDISIIANMPAKWWYNDKVVDDIHYIFGGEE